MRRKYVPYDEPKVVHLPDGGRAIIYGRGPTYSYDWATGKSSVTYPFDPECHPPYLWEGDQA